MPLTLTATSTEFVALPEVKAHANVTSSVADIELEMMRGAAQDVVEGLVGPVLHRVVTETVTARSGVVVLRVAPVVSLTTVTPVPSVLPVLDGPTGILRGVVGTVDVAYVAGRTSVPDAIRLATLIIAGHLWETQRGSSPTALQEEDPAPAGIGYAIPNRALDLLGPYLLPPAVA